MRKVLIYSPLIDGHRQMYVYVLYRLLKEDGFSVYIAFDFSSKFDNSNYIEKIKLDESVIFIDTHGYDGGGLNLTKDDFFDLGKRFKFDITIFPEADHHISFFNSLLSFNKKKHTGKIIGIFLRPFYFYEKKSFFQKIKYIKYLLKNWRTDTQFFFQVLFKFFSVIDIAYCIDENFVNYQNRIKWLPDVFQGLTEELIQENKQTNQSWLFKIEEFKKNNPNRFVFLYFGTAQYRRGYDQVLKMAKAFNGVFVHCGLRGDNGLYSQEIENIRKELYLENRILETNEYIEDPVLIESFFRMTTHIVLPYRNFYGSSGVMIQAISYGIPVLVNEVGIMGYRVCKYHLGCVYNEFETGSLYSQFRRFIQISPNEFQNGFNEFINTQNSKFLKESLKRDFTEISQI